MFHDIFSHLDTICECDGWTEARMEGWTDGQLNRHWPTAKTAYAKRRVVIKKISHVFSCAWYNGCI